MDLNIRIAMNNMNSDVIPHNSFDLVLGKLMDWIMDGKTIWERS